MTQLDRKSRRPRSASKSWTCGSNRAGQPRSAAAGLRVSALAHHENLRYRRFDRPTRSPLERGLGYHSWKRKLLTFEQKGEARTDASRINGPLLMSGIRSTVPAAASASSGFAPRPANSGRNVATNKRASCRSSCSPGHPAPQAMAVCRTLTQPQLTGVAARKRVPTPASTSTGTRPLITAGWQGWAAEAESGGQQHLPDAADLGNWRAWNGRASLATPSR